jgi:hypothetical protein
MFAETCSESVALANKNLMFVFSRGGSTLNRLVRINKARFVRQSSRYL